jgi:hypothetical protein
MIAESVISNASANVRLAWMKTSSTRSFACTLPVSSRETHDRIRHRTT